MTAARPLLFALGSLLASTALAAPAGFAFLEVPVGARAAAMGGAYVAVVDGVDGAFWNPAALAGVQGTQIAGSHAEYIQNLKHDQFAVAGQEFGGGLAASMRAMYSQPIDARDDLGNLTGTFGSNDLEFQLAYGWQARPGARFGAAAQVIRERIDDAAANTWSGSLGGQWTPQTMKSLSFGASAQHLGPDAHFDNVGDGPGGPVPLPAAVQAGAAWTHAMARGLGLTAELDTRATRGRQAVVSLGGELASDVGAALRFGVRQGDDLANFSAGIGYRRGTFSVDYAWVPSKLDLGDTQRFSFAAQF